MTRVEFICGGRALADYRRTNATAFAVAKLFSAERDTSPELVAGAIQETKVLKKRIRELLELAISAEATEALASASALGTFKIVHAVFEGRNIEEVRMLASKIVQREPSVALLATIDDAAARLVFARSASLKPDMNQLLAEACEALGGRGGGKPDMAQGGGPDVTKVKHAIATAFERVRTL
jgi:alanyl-tRNA synthetase